jgi:hypothetical protein
MTALSSHSKTNQFSNFNAPSPSKDVHETQYVRLLNQNKPLAMVQLQECFILLVSNSRHDRMPIN